MSSSFLEMEEPQRTHAEIDMMNTKTVAQRIEEREREERIAERLGIEVVVKEPKQLTAWLSDAKEQLRKMSDPKNREENDKMYYSLYEVTVVDVDSLAIKTDTKVMAKSEEQARGKAGYFDLLAEKEYDTDKLEVRVEKIMSNIKKVEEVGVIAD